MSLRCRRFGPASTSSSRSPSRRVSTSATRCALPPTRPASCSWSGTPSSTAHRSARSGISSQSGELGDVYFITCSRVNLGLHQKDVSVVWDLAPHDLSILEFWLGEAPVSVQALGRSCINNGIPDVAFLSVRYTSGIVAELQVSWLSPVKLRRTIIVGSKKMLMYDDTESVEKVKIFDQGVDYKDPETFGEFQLSYRTGGIYAPKIDNTEPLSAEAAHFVECVATGTRPITDGVAGRSVVAALEAAQRSLDDAASVTHERRGVVRNGAPHLRGEALRP